MENFIFCAVNVKLLQPFHVSVLFLYTLKTLENVWFRNGTLTWDRVTIEVVVTELHVIRSSHQKCSLRKDFLKNFPKFTGKHLCQSFSAINYYLNLFPMFSFVPLGNRKPFSRGNAKFIVHFLVRDHEPSVCNIGFLSEKLARSIIDIHEIFPTNSPKESWKIYFLRNMQNY